MLPEQRTKDQMFLGSFITSQHMPKVGDLCTVLATVVLGGTTLPETVHKTATLGLSCEVITEPRLIWSFVPCSDSKYLQLSLVLNC